MQGLNINLMKSGRKKKGYFEFFSTALSLFILIKEWQFVKNSCHFLLYFLHHQTSEEISFKDGFGIFLFQNKNENL